MRLLSTVAIIVCALFAASTAQAQWTGKAELGVMVSSGNAEATSANTKFDLAHESDKWRQHHLCRRAVRRERRIRHRRALRSALPARLQDQRSPVVVRRAARGARSLQRLRLPGDGRPRAPPTSSSTARRPSSPARSAPVIAPCKNEVLIKTDAGEVIDRIEGESESDPVDHAGIHLRAQLHRDHQAHQQAARGVRVRQYRRAGRHRAAGEHERRRWRWPSASACATTPIRRRCPRPPTLLTTVNLVYNIK